MYLLIPYVFKTKTLKKTKKKKIDRCMYVMYLQELLLYDQFV